MDAFRIGRCVALVVIVFAFELRKASAVFEKAFIGIIKAAAGVFKSLTICFGEPRQILLHSGEQILHPNVAEALFAPLVCFDSAFQHVVVHIPAATQRFVDLFCLLFGGIQTEFEPFIRSQLAPPFLGHPHDLSNTRNLFHVAGQRPEFMLSPSSTAYLLLKKKAAAYRMQLLE